MLIPTFSNILEKSIFFILNLLLLSLQRNDKKKKMNEIFYKVTTPFKILAAIYPFTS